MKSYTLLHRSIILCMIFIQVSHAHGSVLVGKFRRGPSSESVRLRREVCPHGSYFHEGITCCLCAAGQYLTKHCESSDSPDDRKCEQCKEGTYNSVSNKENTCLPCTSCSHENANLEVAEACAVNRDTKCRCKTGHYCHSLSAGKCKICDPCTTCGVDGIKEACTDVKDTVCGEGNGLIIGICVSLLIIGIVAAIIILWKKGIFARGRRKQTTTVQRNGAENNLEVEMQPITVPNVELQPLLSDISEMLGWKDMKFVAMRSGILDTVIESCELDHLGDSLEQTLQLLKKFVERNGRDSPSELLSILEDGGKKAKAERIRNKFHEAASAR